MIQFYTNKDLTTQPEKQLAVSSTVKKLQNLFGHLGCDCHPNYQWAIGIDLDDEGKYIAEGVTVKAAKPCNFLENILQNEIAVEVSSLSTV